MSTPVPGALAALALTSGPRSGEALAVRLPTVTLGRASGCDLVIDDDSVSAQHARLEWAAGAWRITDLGSVNGTAVGGVKLEPNTPTPLPLGSALRLGGVRLELQEVVGADPETASTTYTPPPAAQTLREERRRSGVPLWLVILVLLVLAAAGYLVLTGAFAPAVDAPPHALTAPAAP